jgi:peptide/nickel transport system permease protein
MTDENGADAAKHYVNPKPFDASESDRDAEYALGPDESAWLLIWRKFRRHRVAYASGVFLVVLYAAIPFIEIIAPYSPASRDADYLFAPPQTLRLFHEGQLVGPFAYGYDMVLDMDTFRRDYVVDRSDVQRLRFFCFGDEYLFWNSWSARFHLVCPAEGGTLFLWGTDRLGRDMFSRVAYGTRISLSVGLLGITISLILGIVLGGVSGYYGGWVDNIIQRVIELLRSIPELPLWMALSAALPVTWSPILVYLGITVILGLLDWPSLARAVRSKLLSLREEDFATAAVLIGASPARVIRKHLLPNFTSHLIASATLSIPTMILGETALSFLGLGLRPPVTSWGVLLNEAQNLAAIQFYPWIMAPMAPVILVILAFNFLGDGLRDATDPYAPWV